MPPVVKVYEAIGAFGDGRVKLEGRYRAHVTSSDGSKTYEVESLQDGHEISSNDNASYWQGYVGYPAIAVLLARGLLQASADAVSALSGIAWKKLNRRFENDYEKTLAEVARLVLEKGYDPAAIRTEAETMMEALRKLAPTRGKRRRPPAEQAPSIRGRR